MPTLDAHALVEPPLVKLGERLQPSDCHHFLVPVKLGGEVPVERQRSRLSVPQRQATYGSNRYTDIQPVSKVYNYASYM